MKNIVFILLVFCFTGCGSDPVIGEHKYIVQTEIIGQGRVKGLGVFQHNQTATLTAVPDTLAGYRFKEWILFPSKITISTDEILNIEMDADKYIRVVFEK